MLTVTVMKDYTLGLGHRVIDATFAAGSCESATGS